MLRFVWLTLLALHIGIAGVWWSLMPHGFDGGSSQFWVNEAMPIVVVVLLLVALLARGKLSEALLPPVLAMIPVFWMACAIAGRVVFPDSFASGWHLPFVAGAVLAGLWVKQFRVGLKPLGVIPAVLVALWAGASFPGTQRSPDPSTNPTGAQFELLPPSSDHKMVKLGRDAQLHAIDGRLVVKRDNVILNVQPMLTFADRSPDRSWTELAPPEDNVATKRAVVGKVTSGGHITLSYKDEDASLLDVTADKGALHVDARSRLPKPVYSHANTFAELTVQGHKKLSLAFSPLPQKRIDVPSATAAARFAWLDAAGVLHVTQADNRARGPYTELAAGHLGKAPLAITIFDGDKAMFTVTLDDFAAQASTAASPTAGAGIAVNAIELARGGDAESAPVLITLSLAGTTIGRGTASVGHAAGVYRDRVTVTMP